MKVVDFYDKIVNVFNDPEFKPETIALPDLHAHFAEAHVLELKDYTLTRDKAKEILISVRPRLIQIINNYELSGAGGGQMRSEDDGNFGSFDITRCEEGDDRKNFISKDSESWLLYWWHRLDQEGFVQFTLCVLDKFQRANSDEFNLVSGEAKKIKVHLAQSSHLILDK